MSNTYRHWSTLAKQVTTPVSVVRQWGNVQEKLFDAGHDARCLTLQISLSVDAWVCRPDGIFAASQSVVYFASYSTGATSLFFEIEQVAIVDIAVSDDGTRLILTCEDARVIVIDVRLKVILQELRSFRLRNISQLAVLPDGKTLIVAVGDKVERQGELRIWDLLTGEMINVVRIPHPLEALLLTPMGRLIWVKSSDGWIDLSRIEGDAKQDDHFDPGAIFEAFFKKKA